MAENNLLVLSFEPSFPIRLFSCTLRSVGSFPAEKLYCKRSTIL